MQNIFLVGMPSSGKTTIGKMLARRIRYRFVDTDYLIEKDEGMSITDVFAQKGEDYFRQCEHQILRAIRPDSKIIISTGGGMPCFFDNIDYIKAHGISVFLDVPPDELFARIQKHRANDRPLYNKEDADMLKTLELKYNDRLKFYTQANHHFKHPIQMNDIVSSLEGKLS